MHFRARTQHQSTAVAIWASHRALLEWQLPNTPAIRHWSSRQLENARSVEQQAAQSASGVGRVDSAEVSWRCNENSSRSVQFIIPFFIAESFIWAITCSEVCLTSLENFFICLCWACMAILSRRTSSPSTTTSVARANYWRTCWTVTAVSAISFSHNYYISNNIDTVG